MKKDKKMLLIFPPQWTPVSPHFALASLIGQLRNKGYQASCLDLNVEFYNKILTTEYLRFINDKIKKDYLELFKNIRKIYTKGKKEDKYTIDEKCAVYKFNKIKEFISKGDKLADMIPDLIPLAVGVVKSEDKFFTPNYLIKALNLIDYALKLVSLAYLPTNIEFDNHYINQ